MDIFEVGSKVWFVDEKNPGVWHLLVTEEIVKKNLEGVSRDYLFALQSRTGKQRVKHSRDMQGQFFSERQKAFGFMIDHAKLSINNMMDRAEIKDQATPNPTTPDLKDKITVLSNIESEEAMVELPDGRMAKVRISG